MYALARVICADAPQFTFRIVYASGWAFTLLAVLSMIISIAGVTIVALYVQRIHRAQKAEMLDEKALAKYSRRWYGLMGEVRRSWHRSC